MPQTSKPSPAPNPNKDRSPVAGVTLLIALIVYIIFISKVSLPDKDGFFFRTMLGAAGVAVGGTIYGGALATIESVLKGIIEAIGVVLLLANVIACVLIYTNHESLIELLNQADLAGEHPYVALTIISAVTLFLIDAALFLFIYPMSKIVGTNVQYKEDLRL